jgi:hypothetical protein
MTERWRLVNGQELYDIRADPAQQRDVAAQQPDVVRDLRSRYEDWWTGLSPAFDRYVRIAIGAEAEPRTVLHAHDWHAESDAAVPWNQPHVREGLIANGFWAVEIARPGRYEITLRRWPQEAEGPLEATRARLKVGEKELEQAVAPGAVKAVFEADLRAGPAFLRTWLTLVDGRSRGAYYVHARRTR